MGEEAKRMKCPVCDRRGWYYDPFVNLWKCRKCNYTHKSMYGRKFCYYCGENIEGKKFHFTIQNNDFLFWHNKCWSEVIEKVV